MSKELLAKTWYDKLDDLEKKMLRKRFLDDKSEPSLDTMDYLHMKNMADIVYPGMCGHDASIEEQEIYDLHNPNEEWA